jgi:hypothetical protein
VKLDPAPQTGPEEPEDEPVKDAFAAATPAVDDDTDPKKYTEAAIDARRSEVLSLRLRGRTVKDIADRLGVSVVTVNRDLTAAKQEGLTAIGNFSKDQEIADSLTTYDDIIKAGWTEYDAALGTELKVKTLHLIRQAKNDKMKMVQDVGLVQRESQKLDLNIGIGVLEGWSKELQAMAINGLLQSSLKTPLLAPVPDTDIVDAEVVSEAFVDDVDDSGADNG